MSRAKLTLENFITLVGPAQKLFIIKEDFKEGKDKPLYNGVAAKLRSQEDLLKKEIKFISPTSKDAIGIIWIWVY